MPSRTLAGFVSKVASNAGINDKYFFVSKKGVEAVSHGEKLCVLMMDELSLQNNLYYDAARDHLVVLDDYADGTSSGMLAHSAIDLMV